MFSKDDILARLNAGETADDIADDLAKALNEAKAEHDKAKNDKENKLNLLADEIYAKLLDYITIVAPELVDDEARSATTEDVRSTLESVVRLLKLTTEYGEFINPKTKKSDDDKFADFFRLYNL